MTFTPALGQRLSDPKAEAVRANMQQQIRELQDALSAAIPGRLLGRQLLTGSGTYTPTPGTRLAIVRMVGGGGGGGGAKSTTTGATGAGGHSGWYLDFVVRSTTSNDIAGGAYSCGAGGTAGAATPTNGGDGGDTSLTVNGRTYLAKGGAGGHGATDTWGRVGTPLTGSTAANVDLITYGPANQGSLTSVAGQAPEVSGFGGSIPPFGAGGYSEDPGPSVGIAGQGFGAGASGGSADLFSQTGAAGAPGAILVEEYT